VDEWTFVARSAKSIWNKYHHHPGDRQGLFQAVADAFRVDTVLYPGSYVDIAASFVFRDVTYVDIDDTAAMFFRDTGGVDALITRYGRQTGDAKWAFIHADYSDSLGMDDESFDLLVSLYAGFISRSCARYLRRGALLLVNSSHGDVAMASIDPRFELTSVINHRSGRYTLSDKNLESYLIPKREIEITEATMKASGRGVPYTKSPFAYLFRHV